MKAIIKSIVTDCCRAVVPPINKKAVVAESSDVVMSSDMIESSATEEWADLMLADYLSRNSHVTYTAPQQALILERLQEDYVFNTFGPAGANKTVCDFFLFFQNSNTSTALTARGWTKSGATLRWNYGAGNIYSQNNLPAQICNGVVSVTSTDGFASVTTANVSTNTFINHLPSFASFTGLTTFFCGGNDGLAGAMPAFTACTSMTYFSASYCSFTTPPTLPNSIATVIIGGNDFAGDTPNYAGGNITNMDYFACLFTANGTNTFNKGMTVLNFGNNRLTTAEVDELLANLDAFFTGANTMTANCTITLTGTLMGIPTGGASNTNIASLLSKATTAGVTWAINVRTS